MGSQDSFGHDRRELDELFSLAYEELRRLASVVKRGDPGHTLNPTALVNEAWLKLAKSPPLRAESPIHFKRIAGRAMRQLLVDAARRRKAGKRGEGEALPIRFDDSLAGAASTDNEMIVLDEALSELARVAPRQAAMVESRFFGGLEISEIAVLFDLSEATVLRDWRAAKAWLSQKLQSNGLPG